MLHLGQQWFFLGWRFHMLPYKTCNIFIVSPSCEGDNSRVFILMILNCMSWPVNEVSLIQELHFQDGYHCFMKYV
jgi:hypothetical protein